MFIFQVFLIPGTSSRTACARLRRLCGERLGETGWEIREVDLLQHPEIAAQHRILAIPTIVRLEPTPLVRLIGDLSDEETAAQSLELPPRLASAASR